MNPRFHITLLLLILASAGTPVAAQVVVIAHLSVPADTVTQSQLLDFYTGEKQSWDGRNQVVVYDLKSRGPVRDTFYDYLGKTSSRMRSIWLKRKLSGEGDPPQSFDTEEEMLAHVANTAGAIGFIHISYVDPLLVKELTRIPLEAQ